MLFKELWKSYKKDRSPSAQDYGSLGIIVCYLMLQGNEQLTLLIGSWRGAVTLPIFCFSLTLFFSPSLFVACRIPLESSLWSTGYIRVYGSSSCERKVGKKMENNRKSGNKLENYKKYGKL